MRAVTTSLALALALAGCASANDVELNGKIFDVLGVSAASQKSAGEPKLAARPGLVLPPNRDALPNPDAPDAPVVATAADPAWPKDADETRKAAAAEAARKQQEQCKDGRWRERAMKDDIAAFKGCGVMGAITPFGK